MMTALTLSYPAKIEKKTDDGDYYFVSFRDIANCFTQGETWQEAYDNAQDVLGFMLQDYVEDETTFPLPSKMRQDEVMVEPLPEFCAPLLLYHARIQRRLSQAQVAKTLGISRQRYFDIEHGKNLTMKTFSRSAQAIGFKPNIGFVSI